MERRFHSSKMDFLESEHGKALMKVFASWGEHLIDDEGKTLEDVVTFVFEQGMSKGYGLCLEDLAEREEWLD